MTQEYEYEGEKFTVSKPDDCEMTVSGNGITAKISVNQTTRQYGVGLDGIGSLHDDPTSALNQACRRILDKAKRQTAKELCAGMDDFYASLGKK